MAGDDALGSLVIKKMRTNAPRNVGLIEAGLSGLGLLDLMDGAETVIFIDAAQSGKLPGTIHRLVIPDDIGLLIQSSWKLGTTSTHGFGLGEALTLSHSLGSLPQSTVVYGIEWEQMEIGTPVSSNVNAMLDPLIAAIEKDVEAYICTNSNS